MSLRQNGASRLLLDTDSDDDPGSSAGLKLVIYPINCTVLCRAFNKDVMASA